MACDICGKTGTGLEDLLESYQTNDIKALCPACCKIVNDHLWKIRAMSNKMNKSLLIRFMEAMKIRCAT